MFVEDILKLKDKLLNPKRSDEFRVPLYLEGWRYCDVKIGSKLCTVKPCARGKVHKYSVRGIKEELNQTYWSAALCHAGRKGKRPRNWKQLYA